MLDTHVLIVYTVYKDSKSNYYYFTVYPRRLWFAIVIIFFNLCPHLKKNPKTNDQCLFRSLDKTFNGRKSYENLKTGCASLYPQFGTRDY